MEMWWLMFMSVVAIGMSFGQKLSRKYPFAVQLMSKDGPYDRFEFLGGGSVISPWHVLTAANCLSLTLQVFNEDRKILNQTPQALCPSSIFARVGSTYLYTGGSLHQGSAIILHPDFKEIKQKVGEPLYANDIALLKLAQAVSDSCKVPAVFLPRQGLPVVERANVKICGWGSDVVNESLSNVLLDANAKIVSQISCHDSYRWLTDEYLKVMNETMFCAGVMQCGKDTCPGDSGGPLVNGNFLLGVTSWATGCGLPSYPGVYTRVSKYTNWIKKMMDTEQTDLLTFTSSQVIPVAIPRSLIPLSLILYQVY